MSAPSPDVAVLEQEAQQLEGEINAPGSDPVVIQQEVQHIEQEIIEAVQKAVAAGQLAQVFRYTQWENQGMYTAYARCEKDGNKVFDGKDTGQNMMIGGGSGAQSYQRTMIDWNYKTGEISNGDVVTMGYSIQGSDRIKMDVTNLCKYDSSSNLTVYFMLDGSIGTETIDYNGTKDPY